MAKDSNGSKKLSRRLKNLIPLALILLVFAGIPMIFLNFQAKRSGMTRGAVIKRIMNKAGENDKVSGAVTDNTIGEKVNFLDPELIGEVLDVMKQIAFEGTTMIVVTHEMGFASDVADRVLFVDKGIIVESGPPDQIFRHSLDERTKLFLEPIRKVQQI